MFIKAVKFLFHFAIYTVFFFGLVWLLMGLNPQETWGYMKKQWASFTSNASRVSGYVGKTAGDMKDAADSQLSQANDRLHGIDPYAKLADKFAREH